MTPFFHFHYNTIGSEQLAFPNGPILGPTWDDVPDFEGQPGGVGVQRHLHTELCSPWPHFHFYP